jgi:hypothetical protein
MVQAQTPPGHLSIIQLSNSLEKKGNQWTKKYEMIESHCCNDEIIDVLWKLGRKHKYVYEEHL